MSHSIVGCLVAHQIVCILCQMSCEIVCCALGVFIVIKIFYSVICNSSILPLSCFVTVVVVLQLCVTSYTVDCCYIWWLVMYCCTAMILIFEVFLWTSSHELIAFYICFYYSAKMSAYADISSCVDRPRWLQQGMVSLMCLFG